VLDLRSLNPQQRLAVETLNGPVLILAGAGTGKTRVITFRIAHLIEKGVAPHHILGVTFTNKAAREMLERVNQLVPRTRNSKLETRNREDSRNTQHATRVTSGESSIQHPASSIATPDSRPTICTFHSLCARILRRHIERLGYKRNFVIYSESDQIGAVRKILSRISAKGEKTDPAAILALLSRFRNGGERATAFADESVRAMAQHVRRHYESALRACNAVDFDDLLLLTLRLFKEYPEVLANCRQQYRYVMVDEFQDTNAIQFRLVHQLVGKHQNLCVVGDDDQSIYGWRGAEIANLLDMEKHFPKVKVIKLEQNYRSTNTILRAANAVIKHNVRRRAKQLWSQKGDGAKITLHTFANDDEEARAIVEEIEFQRMARRVPWAQQAVLFRTNSQSRPLETAFRQAGVRYHLVGGQSYFDRREVKDFLAWLKTLLNPHDDVNLLRIANVPARGLSDVTMERLLAVSSERKCSVFAAMKDPAVQTGFVSRTRKSIEAFVKLVEDNHAKLHRVPLTPALSPSDGERENPRQSVSISSGQGIYASRASLSPRPLRGGEGQSEGAGLCAWANSFLDEIAYLQDVRRSEKDAETAESRIRNVKDLLASLDEAAAQSNAATLPDRLQAFLEDITLDTEREGEDEGPGDAVTLITMHSCKGLEFPHVYIVGAEDGLIPHARSKSEGTLDEERRLFYVALTRAMQTLDISHCTGRKKYGQLVPCHASPFLKDLPAELVEHAALRKNERASQEAAKDWFAQMRAAAGAQTG
jgi:superfamily I DNA/RNA helicase